MDHQSLLKILDKFEDSVTEAVATLPPQVRKVYHDTYRNAICNRRASRLAAGPGISSVLRAISAGLSAIKSHHSTSPDDQARLCPSHLSSLLEMVVAQATFIDHNIMRPCHRPFPVNASYQTLRQVNSKDRPITERRKPESNRPNSAQKAEEPKKVKETSETKTCQEKPSYSAVTKATAAESCPLDRGQYIGLLGYELNRASTGGAISPECTQENCLFCLSVAAYVRVTSCKQSKCTNTRHQQYGGWGVHVGPSLWGIYKKRHGSKVMFNPPSTPPKDGEGLSACEAGAIYGMEDSWKLQFSTHLRFQKWENVNADVYTASPRRQSSSPSKRRRSGTDDMDYIPSKSPGHASMISYASDDVLDYDLASQSSNDTVTDTVQRFVPNTSRNEDDVFDASDHQ